MLDGAAPIRVLAGTGAPVQACHESAVKFAPHGVRVEGFEARQAEAREGPAEGLGDAFHQLLGLADGAVLGLLAGHGAGHERP